MNIVLYCGGLLDIFDLIFASIFSISTVNMSSMEPLHFLYHHSAKHCHVSQASSMSPPGKQLFTLFPLLPIELRLEIWEAACALPRTVELSCTPPTSHIPKGRWFSHSPHPVLFFVCHESREIALHQYSTLKFAEENFGMASSLPLYINLKSDTLWLCGDLQYPWARNLLEKNEQLKEGLRFLAVGESLWKQMNQVAFTPGPRETFSSVPISATPVRCGLKALDYLSFHS